ncbi:hypothetical protein NPIL_290201 [Nephila pilipes]|uniref:Uncharacterized protein n=1 Tax=Nephila pilipes TaxID=299642 RepID=A0A8X6R2Q3_NEPPI|nr:hypothetical protein NPIL_290201 [Nephila pilipes]
MGEDEELYIKYGLKKCHVRLGRLEIKEWEKKKEENKIPGTSQRQSEDTNLHSSVVQDFNYEEFAEACYNMIIIFMVFLFFILMFVNVRFISY